jgi:hypothetical protein
MSDDMVKWICGRRVILRTGKGCEAQCKCGATVRFGFSFKRKRRPIVTIPDASLSERIAAGHRVKYDAPKMIFFEEMR